MIESNRAVGGRAVLFNHEGSDDEKDNPGGSDAECGGLVLRG